MFRFVSSLFLISTLGCGSATDGVGDTTSIVDGGAGGSDSVVVPRGGSSNGGAAGSESQAGGASGSAGQGGSDVGQGGSNQGQGGSDVEQGGAGGTSQGGAAGVGGAQQNQGGSGQAGTGGSEQGGSSGGGAGGSSGSGSSGGGGSSGNGQSGSAGAAGSENEGGTNQGGTGGSDQGGSGGSDPDPIPECDWEGGHCEGLNLAWCSQETLQIIECGTPEEGMNCSDLIGCYGSCTNGDVRCTGATAEACVDGEWATAAVCAFQCSNGACEGSCEPGTTRCVGTGTQTCGSNFIWQATSACPSAPNATTSCTGAGVCGLTPIDCTEGTADCDGNGSCEANLTAVTSCGSCGEVCTAPSNAVPLCTGSGCDFVCVAGFADCDGDEGNGCELAVSDDPLNCGGCGLSCYGGSCNASQCDYEFEVVADFSGPTDADEVVDMAVSSTHIYWLTYDALRRAPKDGSGSVQTLASTEFPIAHKQNGLILDGGTLYWTDSAGIFKMPTSGGTPVQLVDTTGLLDLPQSPAALGLAFSNGKLYWNSSQVYDQTGLCAVPPASTDAAALTCNGTKVVTFYTLTIATGVMTSWTAQREFSPVLGVVGNELFVTRFDYNSTLDEHQSQVVTLDVSSGISSRIIATNLATAGLGNTFGMAVFTADAMVYTAKLSSSPRRGLGSAPLASSNPYLSNVLLTSEAEHSTVMGLAANATHAYHSRPSGMYRVSLDGTDSDQLFGAAHAIRIELDTEFVYWSVTNIETGEKAILRAAN